MINYRKPADEAETKAQFRAALQQAGVECLPDCPADDGPEVDLIEFFKAFPYGADSEYYRDILSRWYNRIQNGR